MTMELAQLRQRHDALLERAIRAIHERTHFVAYPDDPRDPAYASGSPAAGEAEARRRIDALSRLEGPTVSSERSALGADWPTRYADEDVDTVLRRAEQASAAWAALPADDRIAVCMEMLDRLKSRAFEMAYACMHTCGQPFMMAFQAGTANALDRALEAMAYAAREMRALPASVLWEKQIGKATVRVEKTFDLHPRGIAVAIACSTFPTWNTYPGLFASLVTGNPVVVKPHPTAVLPLQIFVDVARQTLEDAGLDPDTVQLLADAVERPKAQALVTDPRVKLVDFTGSSAFGNWIETHATQAHVFTEKSGVNVAVLESTADYAGMVRNLALSLSLYSGQMCTTPQNIYVPRRGIGTPEGMRSIDAFRADLAQAIGKLTDPARAFDILGALQSPATQARVDRLDGRHGVVTKSHRIALPDGSAAVVCSPAVLFSEDPNEPVLAEEQFGPVSFVVAVVDREAALAAATAMTLQKGAITWLVHTVDDDFRAATKAAAAAAGVHLTLNMTGPVLVNQSAAFSDLHVSGFNAAGNASMCDPAFVLPRFRVLQTRRYIG